MSSERTYSLFLLGDIKVGGGIEKGYARNICGLLTTWHFFQVDFFVLFTFYLTIQLKGDASTKDYAEQLLRTSS